MSGLRESLVREIIDAWEVVAETEANSTPERRATFREAADVLRMLLKSPLPAAEAFPPEHIKTLRNMRSSRVGALGKRIKEERDALHAALVFIGSRR